MNVNLLKTCYKLAAMLLVLIVTNGTANAQCKYVATSATGTYIALSIPCDFPIFISSGNEEEDRANFNAQTDQWHLNNPDFVMVNLSPIAGGETQIEITTETYTAFSEERKKAIEAYPSFYIIKN